MNATAAAAAADRPAAPSDLYLRCMRWVFLFFNSTRLFAYLPTIVTLWQQHGSNQHSLITWLVFAGANASMAAWLYEEHGRRLDRAIVVSIGNAVMCLTTALLIIALR